MPPPSESHSDEPADDLLQLEVGGCDVEDRLSALVRHDVFQVPLVSG